MCSPSSESLQSSQVRGVTKTYESKGRTYRALDDISLDIEAGKLIALLGPSGSGGLVCIASQNRLHWEIDDADDVE